MSAGITLSNSNGPYPIIKGEMEEQVADTYNYCIWRNWMLDLLTILLLTINDETKAEIGI